MFEFQLGKGQYATMLMREIMGARVPRLPKRIVFDSDDSDEPDAPAPLPVRKKRRRGAA